MAGNKQPWEAYPKIWKSKSAFLTYLRGAIRKALWSRYPPKIEWKNSQCTKPPENYIGKAKSGANCHYCNEWFAKSHLEVDHVQQAGGFQDIDGLSQWISKLIDVNNNWVLACKPCHKIKSYAERTDMSMEDARLEKEIIAFKKLPAKEQIRLLTSVLDASIMPTNASQRAEAYKKYKEATVKFD